MVTETTTNRVRMMKVKLLLIQLLSVIMIFVSSRNLMVQSYHIPIRIHNYRYSHHQQQQQHQQQHRQRSFAILQSSSSSSTSSTSDYNVVLRPSNEVDDVFDNFKVGNCRVHRYSPVINSGSNGGGSGSASDTTGTTSSTTSSTFNSNDGSRAEYVMWYHGRDHALENSSVSSSSSDSATTTTKSAAAALPKLSTGRIGRATSRNGLIWEKDRIGSQSEDKEGVALGLNLESWWSFDTSHVGLGCVLLPLSTPAVLSADGVYLMYYMGGNYEEISILEYLNENDIQQLSPATLDSKLRGMNMKIGVALSQDGISWGRVEGDDPTGACMVPYSKTDPNQSSSGSNSNSMIPEELYCAWPEVIVNESPKTPNEAFIMYYSTMIKETKQKVIAYAISDDGFRWYKRGPCIVPTTTTTVTSNSNDSHENVDGNGCLRCCVNQDATYNTDTMQWVTNVPNTWTMYYEGTSTMDQKHRICMAKSNNGIDWKKESNNIVLDIGVPNTWDCNGVGSPHCIRYGCHYFIV